MNDKWKEAWNALFSYFDDGLCWLFEDMSDVREAFLEKYGEALAMFCDDRQAIVNAAKAVVDGVEIELGDLQTVLASSSTGRAVFAKEALDMDKKLYLRRIEQALKDCEHNNYDVEDVEQTTQVMFCEAFRSNFGVRTNLKS